MASTSMVIIIIIIIMTKKKKKKKNVEYLRVFQGVRVRKDIKIQYTKSSWQLKFVSVNGCRPTWWMNEATLL